MLRHALLGAALLCCAAPASATSARVESLGGGGDYFEDVDNVLRWYGSLPSYGGTALFELGEKTSGASIRNRGAAILAELDRDGAWGTAGMFLFGDNSDEVIRLAWGRRLGAVRLGIQWKLSWESYGWYDHDASSVGWLDAVDQVFGAGLRWEMDDRTYLDVAADITEAGREVEMGDATIEPENFSVETYSWRCRGFHALSDATVIVPLVSYDRFLQTAYLSAQDGVYDWDLDAFQAGLGFNHLPDADTMLVGSFTYGLTHDSRAHPRDESDENRLTATYHAYDLRLGVERRLLGWLTLRAGAWQSLVLHDVVVQESPGGPGVADRSSDEDLDISLGIALHFGPFDADFAFQENAPFNFGSFITQAETYEDSTWSRITLQCVF
ncbi:hypothetical protein KKG45_11820 [bacterium]|nr:hypothetical protein [bacterium]MBU1073924.1 hypothetical protein [bacterium]